jgi:hypothetical protein
VQVLTLTESGRGKEKDRKKERKKERKGMRESACGNDMHMHILSFIPFLSLILSVPMYTRLLVRKCVRGTTAVREEVTAIAAAAAAAEAVNTRT